MSRLARSKFAVIKFAAARYVAVTLDMAEGCVEFDRGDAAAKVRGLQREYWLAVAPFSYCF